MILVIGGCGYIGSRLTTYLRRYHDVWSVDLEWFGSPIPKNTIANYASLTPEFLNRFDAIILLAGHSSVAMAENEQTNALINNVAYFEQFLLKLNKHVKFIYASSSSVYNSNMNAREEDELEESVNIYDYSKLLIDKMAWNWGENIFGLRFGTVNGSSPNFRPELMINKMFVTSKSNSSIEIYNEHVSRPILGLFDLCCIINLLIDTQEVPPGIYNVCSFNATVGEIAERVSKLLLVDVVDKGSTPTYDFALNNDKICEALNFEFTDSINSIVNDLIANQKEFGESRDVSNSGNLPLL